MKRVVRGRKIVSGLIWALRGMTAGSGFATTEMRVVMINLVEKALEAHPSVSPTVFVDDLAAESAGPDKWIETEPGLSTHLTLPTPHAVSPSRSPPPPPPTEEPGVPPQWGAAMRSKTTMRVRPIGTTYSAFASASSNVSRGSPGPPPTIVTSGTAVHVWGECGAKMLPDAVGVRAR